MGELTVRRAPWLAQLGVFIALFCAYMLTTSRALPYSDGKVIHAVAESIVHRGEVNIPVGFPGRDGKAFAPHPIVPSAIHVPGAYLHKWTLEHRKKSTTHELTKALGSHIGPSAMGALAGVALFDLAFVLGLGVLGATLTTFAGAFGTIAWVYARYPYSEICQLAAFTGFFAAMLRVAWAPNRWAALAAGSWAGFLINTKLVFALSLPGGLLWIAWRLRRERRTLIETIVASAIGLLPWVLLAVWYNDARFGAASEVGYAPSTVVTGPAASERMYIALWGMFLSPAKSIFVYSPPLVLSLLALRTRDQRMRDVLVGLAVTVGPVVALLANLPFWSGDLAWGPRYLVFATGALLAPASLWLDQALRERRKLSLGIATAALGAGLFVQGLGNLFYWDGFVRVAAEARAQWLGQPNRTGSAFFRPGRSCEPCFEDLAHFIWLPPFNPVEINWWLARHILADHDWVTAEADAPWKRYTSLRLNVSDPYRRAKDQIDWWYLGFEKHLPNTGKILIKVELGLVLFGAGLCALGCWRWRRRRAPLALTDLVGRDLSGVKSVDELVGWVGAADAVPPDLQTDVQHVLGEKHHAILTASAPLVEGRASASHQR